MRRHTQHSLRGGRFAVLYDLADNRTLAAARSVNVESELGVLNEILSHRDFMDEGREFDMDLISTLMAGLVVAYDVQMEDWSNKLDDLVVDLRQAIASFLPGSNQSTGSSNTTVEVGPPPRGPPRKSQRKEIRGEIDDISQVQLVAALVADTQPMDVNLLGEEDPPVPVPQDQSFGNETPEQALATFMRDRLFLDETVELPRKVPSVLTSTETTGLAKLTTALKTTGNTTAELVSEPEPVTAPMLEEPEQVNEVLEERIQLAERGQEVVQPLDLPLPEVSASIADVVNPQPDVVNPQQDIIVVGVDDEPRGPVPRWKRRRVPPRLDVILPAPHLRYSVQTEEQIMMLIDAHERFVLDKLLNPVPTPEPRVRRARIPDTVQPVDLPEALMEPDRSGMIMPQVDTVPTVEITQDRVEQEALSYIQPDPHFEEPTAMDESAKATTGLSPLQAKLEESLGPKLVELAEKATVNLSDFMLQLMKGPMTYCQLLPPEANYRDVVLAGMEEKCLLHLDQEDTLNCGKISIVIEERPERNAAFELLCEAFHAV